MTPTDPVSSTYVTNFLSIITEMDFDFPIRSLNEFSEYKISISYKSIASTVG